MVDGKIKSVVICTMITFDGFQQAASVILESNKTIVYPPVRENGYAPVLPENARRFMETAEDVEVTSGEEPDRTYKIYTHGNENPEK